MKEKLYHPVKYGTKKINICVQMLFKELNEIYDIEYIYQ
jgi:hypothetical protein